MKKINILISKNIVHKNTSSPSGFVFDTEAHTFVIQYFFYFADDEEGSGMSTNPLINIVVMTKINHLFI